MSNEEFVLHCTCGNIPSEVVVEVVAGDVTIAFLKSHFHLRVIFCAITQALILVLLGVFFTSIHVTRIEIGAVEEQTFCQLVRERKCEVEGVFAQVVASRRLRRAVRHRKDVTLARKRKSSVELTHIVVVGEVGIELCAVGEDVGERGSNNERSESLKIAETIGVFIT